MPGISRQQAKQLTMPKVPTFRAREGDLVSLGKSLSVRANFPKDAVSLRIYSGDIGGQGHTLLAIIEKEET